MGVNSANGTKIVFRNIFVKLIKGQHFISGGNVKISDLGRHRNGPAHPANRTATSAAALHACGQRHVKLDRTAMASAGYNFMGMHMACLILCLDREAPRDRGSMRLLAAAPIEKRCRWEYRPGDTNSRQSVAILALRLRSMRADKSMRNKQPADSRGPPPNLVVRFRLTWIRK